MASASPACRAARASPTSGSVKLTESIISLTTSSMMLSLASGPEPPGQHGQVAGLMKHVADEAVVRDSARRGFRAETGCGREPPQVRQSTAHHIHRRPRQRDAQFPRGNQPRPRAAPGSPGNRVPHTPMAATARGAVSARKPAAAVIKGATFATGGDQPHTGTKAALELSCPLTSGEVKVCGLREVTVSDAGCYAAW